MKYNHLATSFLLFLSVTLSASFAPAQSQQELGPANKQASVQTKSRTRRVARKPVDKPAAATATQPKVEAGEVNKSQQKATADTISTAEESAPETADTETQKQNEVVQPAPVPADPIAALREQIEAAGTPSEKVRLQFQLVDLLVAGGAKADAINELHLMRSEERFDPQGFYNIGNGLARLDDADGAVVAYRKAIEQRKGRYSKALNNLGVMLLRQGLWDEAFESFSTALRLENFRYAEASYNLGRLYAARGEMDLAVREWRRALVVNPEHNAAAQAIAAAGNEGRIAVVAPSKRSTAGSSPAVASALPASRATSPTRSEKTLKPAVESKQFTVDPETYSFLQRARTARERNRQEEAVENYRRVIARMDGYFAPANLELSYSLITLKRLDEALPLLLSVTQHDGGRYPISYYHLARLYEGRGDLRQAEEYFKKAADSYRDDNAQFLLDVSRVREKLGDVQGALNVLEEYIAAMERKNLKPDWSNERLASLRQKLTASQPK